MVRTKMVARKSVPKAPVKPINPPELLKKAKSNVSSSSSSKNQVKRLAAKKSAVQAPVKKVLPKSKKIQKSGIFSHDYCIPKAPLYRIIKEFANNYLKEARITRDGLDALHMAAEDYMVDWFDKCNQLAEHAKRVTVMSKDMRLLAMLRKMDKNLF